MFGSSMQGRSRVCREGNALRVRDALAVLCLLVAWAAIPDVLRAQSLPDAGRTLQDVSPALVAPRKSSRGALPSAQERPAMTAPSSRRLMVRHWRITGAQVFPVSKLQSLVSGYRGEELTLAELEKVAGVITAYYRRRGYLLSRAYIPAQTVDNDTVEIAVIEGHLSDIHVTNGSVVAGAVIKAHLEHLLSLGPVQGPGLERSLMLLNDLPGIDVQSTLRPGATVGTSELDVEIHDTARLSGSVDADNFGNRYTGQFRGGGTLDVNEPLHLGDLFTLRGDTSGPGMTYGRAGWQVPLGGSGLEAGAAGSYLRYELGNKFASLDARGSAQVESLWASYPVTRGVYHDLAVQVSYDRKQLDDRIGAVGSDTRKNLDVFTLGLSGDETDGFGGWGVSSYSLAVVGGRLGLDPLTAALDRGVGGHHTLGSYYKLAFSYHRTQHLAGAVDFSGTVTGQISHKNLDSSETLSLGGVNGVRAYPQDEGVGDDAVILNLELRGAVAGVYGLSWRSFFDIGMARAYHSPLPTDTDNRRTLAGEGLGLQWLRPGRPAVSASVAWRATGPPVTDADRRPRVWLQIAQHF